MFQTIHRLTSQYFDTATSDTLPQDISYHDTEAVEADKMFLVE